MKNRKGLIAIIVIVVLGLMFYGSFKRNFNTMNTMQKEAEGQWAKVESSYQRRADLIPNLVNTVKGYAEHEKETLTQVIEARSKATSVSIDPSKLDAGTIQQFQQAQSGLSSALSKLMVVVEKYPDLKANQNFLELQAQLEGTENRINVERNRYTEIAKNYNISVTNFPQRIYAAIFNFDEMPLFEAQQGAEVAPTVEF